MSISEYYYCLQQKNYTRCYGNECRIVGTFYISYFWDKKTYAVTCRNPVDPFVCFLIIINYLFMSIRIYSSANKLFLL